MNKLHSFANKSSRVGAIRLFFGLKPLELELSFEAGFDEAREWLEQPATKEELERLCQASRAKRKAAYL
jgi:hypothetical protein